MESEPWWGSDPKDGPRIKASREEWKKLQAAKSGPCRVCGAAAYTGNTSLHHLVPRSGGGDDVEDNLVPLCGSGTTGCHGKIESRDKEASRRLRANLSKDEYEYVVRKKGWDWLDQRYPLEPTLDIPKADGIAGSVWAEPGHDCPTCNRRIPYPKTDKTPTNRPFSFRIPEEHRDTFRETLEATSRHIGIHDRPFWQWNTVNAGLVLLLQGEKDLLR